MKKTLIILGSVGVGYMLNTETSKKLITWALGKAQDQINNLVSKVNEVTDNTSTAPAEEVTE